MEAYETAIEEAVEASRIHCYFGIVPTKPETGYGYIQRDDVISFREKPNQVSAHIAKGNFLWNSGMFCFKAGVCWKN
jgi:mannose-1-phosphate guanylyltransferase